jgi:hypothetical protein
MKSLAHAQAIRERRIAFLMFSRFWHQGYEASPIGNQEKGTMKVVRDMMT